MELGAGKAKWKRRGVGRWVGGRDARDVGKGVRESGGIGRLITLWPRIGGSTRMKSFTVGTSGASTPFPRQRSLTMASSGGEGHPVQSPPVFHQDSI
jgi:hypothetical protein